MNAILITYDLGAPGQKYEAVHKVIKDAGSSWWHYLDSTWLIAGYGLTPEGVAEKIRKVTDESDSLLCIDVSKDAYQGYLPQAAWDWMRKYV